MPSDQGGRFLDEEAAVRAVIAAIEDALERMHAASDRILVRRGLTAADRRFLAEMEGTLVALAEQLADKAVYGGRYGKLLEEAFRKGAAVVEGAMIHVDPETIRAALWPAQVKIKDLMNDGSRAITELTAKAMVAGWSQRELSERIQDEVKLAAPGEGGPYSVPEWRAEIMAREEPLKVHAQATARSQGWTDDTPLTMYGPNDARTAGDICSDYVGKTMTLREWREVVVNKRGDTCDPAGHRMHPLCRHRWLKAVGVKAKEVDYRAESGEVDDQFRAEFSEKAREATDIVKQALNRQDFRWWPLEDDAGMPFVERAALVARSEGVEWLRSAEAAQRDAVHAWTTPDGYRAINAELRGSSRRNTFTSREDAVGLSERIREVMMMDAAEVKTTFTVFRGMAPGRQYDRLMRLAEGRSYTDPGFMGTTLLPSKALEWTTERGGKLVLEITIRPGARGINAEPLAMSPNEAEFLLHRESTLILKKKRLTPDGITILELEVIPRSGR